MRYGLWDRQWSAVKASNLDHILKPLPFCILLVLAIVVITVVVHLDSMRPIKDWIRVKKRLYNISIKALLLKKGSCTIFQGLVNLLLIYKTTTSWNFSILPWAFHITPVSLPVKNLTWSENHHVGYSRPLSFKPTEQYLGKPTQIVLSVAWVVSVLRGRSGQVSKLGRLWTLPARDVWVELTQITRNGESCEQSLPLDPRWWGGAEWQL